jgi:hypothetical protein
VVVAGDTFMVVPVNDPGCQLYVDAPVPVILVLPPAQMVALVTVVPTLGNAFTVMSRVAVALHPLAPVPVTVYVVVLAGDTLMVVPVNDPGCQL